jgi:hypothetical protein
MRTKTPTPILPKPRAKAKPANTPFPVRIALVFTVDGQPRGNIRFEVEASTPPAGDGLQIAIPIDAAQLAQVLTPITGPSAPEPAKLWRPGMPTPVALARSR